MRRETFGDYETDIYGYELTWIDYDLLVGDGEKTRYFQFFLDYEFDKAREIAHRMKKSNRFEDVKLYFLTKDFKQVFGYVVDIDEID